MNTSGSLRGIRHILTYRCLHIMHMTTQATTMMCPWNAADVGSSYASSDSVLPNDDANDEQ
jgi:hypothetical protein